jgi:hypothetical protein
MGSRDKPALLHTATRSRRLDTMDWMNRLLNGSDPLPPNSARSAESWDRFVALASSRDGHQRQAAVRALSESRHAPALPVLLLRLNDWVEAVRRDARVAVDNFLVDELLDAWTGALDGVAALSRGGRTDHGETLARIVAWLQHPQRLARLRATNVRVPRAVERLLLRARLDAPADGVDRLAAWHDGFRSADIVLAGDAADALRTAAAGLSKGPLNRPQVLGLAETALGSRFSRIRLAGWRVALELDPQRGLALAQDMCFDRNVTARALAIAALRDDPVVMTRLVERAIAGLGDVNTARRRAASLDALCSLDDAQGLATCQRLLHDPAPSVRMVALRRVVAGASGDALDAIVHPALADRAAKVRRIAAAQVHRGASPPAADVLVSLCVARPDALGCLLGVAARLPPWDRIGLLLELARHFVASAPQAERVCDELGQWHLDMSHCYVTPTPARSAAVRHAWSACRDLLPRTLQAQVTFHLRAFGVLPG